ncbi:MAG: membrane protein insertion efficiency factor YidD [Eubacteriales bacterium]
MKKAVLSLIMWYRNVVSPLLPPRCRFIPSCSEYGYQAIEVHGLIRGGMMTLWRFLRCHPFHKEKTFIHDPVKPKK